MEPPARSPTYNSVHKPRGVQCLLLIQQQYAAVIKVVTYYCADERAKKEQKGNLAEQMVDNDSDSEQKYC